MGISFRKSKSFGPLRLNFSQKGLGLSVGVKGLRVGTRAGSSGVYLRGGKGPIRFNERLSTPASLQGSKGTEAASPDRAIQGDEVRRVATPSPALTLRDAGTVPPKSRVRLDTVLNFGTGRRPDDDAVDR